ncbi:MAG: endonuclease III [Peptostreptococcaceae bacterium]|nr:endonuclease III [Peptostreptococcaceae bacterium]
MNRQTRIINKIIEMYPDAKCELDFMDPFQLLIATMLSAQTTDKQVNKVTVNLFRDFSTPELLSKADPETVKSYINSLGFFNTKAENIINTSRLLVEKHQGIVPGNMEELTKLPGVGRKTANVVLSNAFDVPAFAVDTHVKRVCYRLGLTKNTDPDKVEKDITAKIPKKLYNKAHHALIFHGRRTCRATRPFCHLCELMTDCPHYGKMIKV